MQIAVVLYGQPRDYLKGYNNIMKFINKQEDCKFNFFFHCWTLNENEIYKCSPWRNINNNELVYNKNVISELIELYNPILYEFENQNNVIINESLYKDTIVYNDTDINSLSNINNTLFQMYSRNKARNLLNKYLIDTNNINYDFVMHIRFDINDMPKINFNELNKSQVYISNLHLPRISMPDNCIITNPYIFLEWFNIYEMLNDILNDNNLLMKITSLNEKILINPEQLILAKYIYHYNNTDNIAYFSGGSL